MKLYENWREIVKKAWSIRLIVLAGMLTGCEVMLPIVSSTIPAGMFAGLSFVATTAAFIARLIAQKDV